MTQSYDVIVLGGGAAGLMCAAVAGRRGRSVVVLERNRDIGEKIRISGGGRCNFTNTGAGPENYLSQNPRFATSALARYLPADFIAMVERHGIGYHEKKLGQLFCDISARDIIEMLRGEVTGSGGVIVTGVEAGEVTRGDRFRVNAPTATYEAETLVVATGGLSIPKLGATGFGYRLAEQFGLRIVPCAPALVPLRWPEALKAQYSDLSGVSFPCVVGCNGTTFREDGLFTHRGLSGPAILQISSYWNPGDAVALDLMPGQDAQTLLLGRKQQPGRTEVLPFLAHHLPRRLAQRWAEQWNWPKTIEDAPNRLLEAVSESLHRWQVVFEESEGYAKAEVTRGGVDTRALSPKTMEAKAVPGLYFVGEVVDVTGWLGGYNFQWAWASGYAAGQAV